MKWCQGIINFKLNVVRVSIIFILIIKVPSLMTHINYSICTRM